MATYSTYSLDCNVRYKLELVRDGNSLRVGGQITQDGVNFLLDSGLGLLDSDHAEIILDMRDATAATPCFVAAVAWMSETATERSKSLAVIASGQQLEWLRDAGIDNVWDDVVSDLVN